MPDSKLPAKHDPMLQLLSDIRISSEAILHALRGIGNPIIVSAAEWPVNNLKATIDSWQHNQRMNLANRRGPVREMLRDLERVATKAAQTGSEVSLQNIQNFDQSIKSIVKALEIPRHDTDKTDIALSLSDYWPNRDIFQGNVALIFSTMPEEVKQRYKDADTAVASLRTTSPNATGFKLIVIQKNTLNDADVRIYVNLSDRYFSIDKIEVVHDPLEDATYDGDCSFIDLHQFATAVRELFYQAGFDPDKLKAYRGMNYQYFRDNMKPLIAELKTQWPRCIDSKFTHRHYRDNYSMYNALMHWTDFSDKLYWEVPIPVDHGITLYVYGVDDIVTRIKINSDVMSPEDDTCVRFVSDSSQSQVILDYSVWHRTLIQFKSSIQTQLDRIEELKKETPELFADQEA